jgi:KUP system potassium uptake protein
LRNPAVVIPFCALFLMVDLAFFVATLFKIPEGGWFPLLVASAVFSVRTTWRTGRGLIQERLLRGGLPIERFVASLSREPPLRTPGTGAYLFATAGTTPPALLATLRHHDALHEQILLIAIVTEKRPAVPPAQRERITDLGLGFYQVVLHYGFMEVPDVPGALAEHVAGELGTDLSTISYFVGRESVRITARPGMARWREHLFAAMSRNTTSAANYFKLPLEQTLEQSLGVEL